MSLPKKKDRRDAVQLCVAIEELDKSLRATVKMAFDNKQRLDESGRLSSESLWKEHEMVRTKLKNMKNNLEVEEGIAAISDSMDNWAVLPVIGPRV